MVAALAPAHRPPGRASRRLVLLMATALLLFLGFDGRALAQSSNEFLVNSVADKVDADVVDDTCDADPGPAVECTLRAAIIQANVTPGEQVIRLQPRVYRLTIPGANENQSFTGDLDVSVSGAVQIAGTSSGRARSTVDATGLGDRVLHNAASGTKLHNVVITGGAPPDPSGPNSFNQSAGGGLLSDSQLTLTDSVVRGNSAAGGGGVFAPSGVTIDRSTISDNRATSSLFPDRGGGGILGGDLTPVIIENSTVENNTSVSSGGGLSIGRGSRIMRSLIAGNSSQRDGGGILMAQKAHDIIFVNSTVSANFAAERGGGIQSQRTSDFGEAPFILRGVTIAGNRSLSGFGGVSDFFLGDEGDLDFEAINTLLANNVGGNCEADFEDPSSFNLSSDSSCAFKGTANQHAISARLGALQFNGGPTRTHALLPDSPAINAGPLRGLCPLTDQRGGIRPTNLNPSNPGVDPCDIGAFELNAVNVGRFKLTPKAARVTATRLAKLKLTWWHPKKWRDLDTVDVQLRRKQATPLWVRFTQGASKTNGISATNGLTLYNSDGTFAGVGKPGRPRMLRSDTGGLDLARSRVRGSGPNGKKVTLTLAVRLKRPTAGKRYTTTLLARDDNRLLQGPNKAGTLTIAHP